MIKMVLLVSLCACGPEYVGTPDATPREECCRIIDGDIQARCFAATVEPGTCDTITCSGDPAPKRIVVCAPD